MKQTSEREARDVTEQQQDAIGALTADGDELGRLLTGLDAKQWALPTPSIGWTIAHQIAHLAATFKMAGAAAADPTAFKAMTAQLGPDFDANVMAALGQYLSDPPETLLARFKAELDASVEALAAVPAGQMVPWLVNPLPADVLASAGMMELFGHGQDVADALGVAPNRTDRIKYLVVFGVRTMSFGYLARGETPPDGEFRFELTSPSGEQWEFGPDDATQKITGPAVDFCLLVTRRRHRDDLAMKAVGAEAEHWLDIAQAYRGPAGAGRTAGQFAGSGQ